MKKALLLYTILCFSAFVSAQTRQAITVTDWGELYSTYELTSDDIAAINSQCPKGELEKIKAAYNESQWPSAINNLDGRNELRPKMFDYHVYKVATLPGGEFLIVAPAAQNKHMPTDMQSTKDIYFVLSASGFTGTKRLDDDYGTSQPAADYVAVDYSNLKTFDEQFNAILTESTLDFVNLWGEDLYDDYTYAEQYVSTIIPIGAQTATINATYDYYYEFWADYGTFTSQIEAKNAFISLVGKVDKAQITCCTLTKGEDIKNETTAASVWNDYDQAISLEVGVMKFVPEGSEQIQYNVYLLVNSTY